MAVFVVVIYHMDRAILVEKGDQLEPAITETQSQTGPECDESGKVRKTFTVRDIDECGRVVEVSKPFDGTVLFTTSVRSRATRFQLAAKERLETMTCLSVDDIIGQLKNNCQVAGKRGAAKKLYSALLELHDNEDTPFQNQSMAHPASPQQNSSLSSPPPQNNSGTTSRQNQSMAHPSPQQNSSLSSPPPMAHPSSQQNISGTTSGQFQNQSMAHPSPQNSSLSSPQPQNISGTTSGQIKEQKETVSERGENVPTYNNYTKDQLWDYVQTADDFAKVSKLLFRKLFTEDEMKGRSLTGTAANKKTPARPALQDQRKLQVIYELVQKKWPFIRAAMVNGKLSELLKPSRNPTSE